MHEHTMQGTSDFTLQPHIAPLQTACEVNHLHSQKLIALNLASVPLHILPSVWVALPCTCILD